jgi:hypothetical protein
MRRREVVALISGAAVWPLPAHSQQLARIHRIASTLASAPSGWEIGPVINGRQYSVGMPTSPTPDGEGFWFDFPVFDRATANTMPAREIPSVHYVTRPGKVMPGGTMRATFEIHGGPFWATEVPDETPAKVRLFFQRSGDDWAGSPGRTEFYRWWGALADLVPGRSTLEAQLVPEKWGSVMGKRGADNSAAFHEAIANIARIGLTFGGGYAGHGVYAVAAARFRLISLA